MRGIGFLINEQYEEHWASRNRRQPFPWFEASRQLFLCGQRH